MARPNGSCVSADFPYKVTQAYVYQSTFGETLYVSFPVPYMPKAWNDDNLKTAGQKVSLNRQVTLFQVGDKLESHWYLDNANAQYTYSHAPTSPFKYTDQGVIAWLWQTEETSDESIMAQPFEGNEYDQGLYRLRLCEGAINLVHAGYSYPYIDAMYGQMANDKAYTDDPHTDALDYERQPRTTAAKRRYAADSALTAYQVMQGVSHSLNKMAYEATRWTFFVPFFGGHILA